MAKCRVRQPLPSSLRVQHKSLRRYGASVDVQFTPVMSIFAFVPDRNVQSQFKSLSGGINSLLWTHNFADVNLPSSFVLNLAWNASLSEFVLSLVN